MKKHKTRKQKIKTSEKRAIGKEKAEQVRNILGKEPIQAKMINGSLVLTIRPQDIREYLEARCFYVDHPLEKIVKDLIEEGRLDLDTFFALPEEDQRKETIGITNMYYRTFGESIDRTVEMFMKHQTALVDAAISSIYINAQSLAQADIVEQRLKEWGSPEELALKSNISLEEAKKVWESLASKDAKAWATRAIENHKLHVYGIFGLDDEDEDNQHGGFRTKKSDLNSTENQLFKDNYSKISQPLWDKVVDEYLKGSSSRSLGNILSIFVELTDHTDLVNKLLNLTNAPILKHPGFEDIRLEYAARLCPSYKPNTHSPGTLKKYLQKNIH